MPVAGYGQVLGGILGCFAFVLECVAEHFPDDKIRTLDLPSTSYVVKHRTALRRASLVASARLDTNPDGAVQKIFYEEFTKALYGTMPIELFERRLRHTFAPFANPLPVINWPAAFAQLRKSPKYEVFTVVWTWANSWTTSSRYHDDVLERCAFECRTGGDDLSHYIMCSRLWAAVSRATGQRAAAGGFQRMCIEGTNHVSVDQLRVAFMTYHTLKWQHLDKLRTGRNFGPLTLSIAEAAAKRSVSTRQVSDVAQHE